MRATASNKAIWWHKAKDAMTRCESPPVGSSQMTFVRRCSSSDDQSGSWPNHHRYRNDKVANCYRARSLFSVDYGLLYFTADTNSHTYRDQSISAEWCKNIALMMRLGRRSYSASRRCPLSISLSVYTPAVILQGIPEEQSAASRVTTVHGNQSTWTIRGKFKWRWKLRFVMNTEIAKDQAGVIESY